MAVTMYSAGTYVPFFNKVQTSDAGDTRKFDLNPYFGIGTQLPMSGPHYFMPEFGYAYFMEPATNTRKDMFFLHYNFAYTFSESLIWRYGLTTHWYRLMGLGGTQTLDNGNSTTEFNSPDRTVITYFTTLNLGAEFFINREMSLRFDLNMMNSNDLEDRAYNYLFTLNFYR